MLVIKGVYEHGQVRLLEPVPSNIEEPQEVTVAFDEPQTEQESQVAQSGQTQVDVTTDAALALIGLLDDLTPEQLEAFDSIVERRSPFFGPREVTW